MSDAENESRHRLLVPKVARRVNGAAPAQTLSPESPKPRRLSLEYALIAASPEWALCQTSIDMPYARDKPLPDAIRIIFLPDLCQ